MVELMVSLLLDGVLALSLYLLYRPTLHGPFLFDDLTILNSRHMLSMATGNPPTPDPEYGLPNQLPFAGFLLAFRHNGWRFLLRSIIGWIQFRPLTYWTYERDIQRNGLNPRGYRLTSLFIGISTVLAFKYLVALLLISWSVPLDSTAVIFLSFLCALLACVHPLLTMSIAYIAGRSSLLCLLFLLLSCISVLIGWYIFTPVFMLLSLLSKEEGIVSVPLIIGLIFIRGAY